MGHQMEVVPDPLKFYSAGLWDDLTPVNLEGRWVGWATVVLGDIGLGARKTRNIARARWLEVRNGEIVRYSKDVVERHARRPYRTSREEFGIIAPIVRDRPSRWRKFTEGCLGTLLISASSFISSRTLL